MPLETTFCRLWFVLPVPHPVINNKNEPPARMLLHTTYRTGNYYVICSGLKERGGVHNHTDGHVRTHYMRGVRRATHSFGGSHEN